MKPPSSPTSEPLYRCRRTGEIVRERFHLEPLQRWFYGTSSGFRVFETVFNHRAFCWLIARWMDHPVSRRKIGPFIARHRIDVEEMEFPPDRYGSFNAFFARRLKPGARPFSPDPDALCAPVDGKALVFPSLAAGVRIPVKGGAVSVASLLASETLARRYEGGSAVVLRLAFYDYHRFHFPDGGQAGPARKIPGRYYHVNPVALARVPDLLARNTRAVTELTSAHFGTVACVEIGAFLNASIVQTYAPGPVARGQEKGFFQFGGSTVVLLFEPGAVVFDDDLVRDSAQGLEVHVQAGSQVGRRV
ncbi:MAG: phosphatidylserine decarboxylase [Candidatus Latescibacteria bacterium]|nr:phosphatidylserine decarboxylase [Candidatus Latescibacterota bacterium]